MKKSTYDYIVQEVESADPAKLIDLLFQRAQRDLDGAQELWPSLPQSPAAVQLAVHAQRIIQELQASLNFDAGGPLSIQLFQLYEFMQYTIMEAVSSRQPEDLQKIQDVREMLGQLASAWTDMMQSGNAGTSSAAMALDGTLVA